MSQPKVRRFLFVHLGAHSVWPMPFALRLLWLAHGVLAAVLPRFQKKWRLDLWLSARIPCGRWSKLGHPPFCHVCLFASGREGALKRQSFFLQFWFSSTDQQAFPVWACRSGSEKRALTTAPDIHRVRLIFLEGARPFDGPG